MINELGIGLKDLGRTRTRARDPRHGCDEGGSRTAPHDRPRPGGRGISPIGAGDALGWLILIESNRSLVSRCQIAGLLGGRHAFAPLHQETPHGGFDLGSMSSARPLTFTPHAA